MGLVRLFLPDQDNREWLNREVLGPIAKRFGGYTVLSGDGGWMSDNDELVTEPVVVVEVYRPTPDKNRFQQHEDLVWFSDLARRLCDMMAQECVLLDFQGVHRLVKGDR
jgi:hypothetical protein